MQSTIAKCDNAMENFIVEADRKDRLSPCVTCEPLLGSLESRDALFDEAAGKSAMQVYKKKHNVTLAVRREANAKRNSAACIFIFLHPRFIVI